MTGFGPSPSLADFPTDLLLRLLSQYGLSARHLAVCAASCRLFSQLVDLPMGTEHVSLSLTEAAAMEGCKEDPLFHRIQERTQAHLRQRCGGSWTVTLHYLQALRAVQTNSHGQAMACRDFTLLVSPHGQLYSFGCGSDARLGTGLPANVWHPLHVSGLQRVKVRHVSAGPRHTVACTQGGAVYTWGIDQWGCAGHGVEGLGPPAGDAVPVPRRVQALTAVEAVQVAAGFDFTAVLSREGEVLTFGSNKKGCLGHGAVHDETIPRRVRALQAHQVSHIAAGLNHMLAATADGHLYSWGEGTNGKLGHGTRDPQGRPRRVERLLQLGVHVTAVSGGVDISVAQGAAGEVFSWGWGCSGRLGHGGYGDEMLPRQVKGLEGVRVVQIGATSKRTFAVSDLGHLYTFGWAAKRALELTSCHVAQASMGTGHTVVITGKGQVLAYGAGERGQLGFNPDNESMHVVLPTPVPLPGWHSSHQTCDATSMEVEDPPSNVVSKPPNWRASRPLEPYRPTSLRVWGGPPGYRGGHIGYWNHPRL